MRLAVIPARGGSKRIVGKNIREFCGKPILAYSIHAAIESKAFDAVWVSTDDPHIAKVAKQFGAEVPFYRPESLADDHTIMQDVMVHALGYAKKARREVTDACLIFATAPFILADDLRRGYDSLKRAQADFALSVAQFRNAPQRAQCIDSEGFLHYANPEFCDVRSQDLKPMYHDAAQFVWGSADAFLHSTVRTASIVPVEISANKVVDIDTPDDWDFAERLYYANSSFQQQSAA